MYKACIFDLDGTLANTLSSIAYFANTALQKCGYQTIPENQYRYLVGNGAAKLVHNMLDAVCGAGAYGEEDVQRLREVYDELYEGNPTLLVTNYPGMPETVEKLKSAGLKLAVLSNKPHNCTTAVVEALYGEDLFDCCYGQQPGIARKPSPEGALRIADELQIEPKDFLYIGDTNTDMKTGAAAGMDTIGVLWGFRDEKELKENQAKFIIERPEQIYRIAASSMR